MNKTLQSRLSPLTAARFLLLLRKRGGEGGPWLPFVLMAVAGCLILSCDPGIQSQQTFRVEEDRIQLTNDFEFKSNLAWSPDGRMIAYTQRDDGTRFLKFSIADTSATPLLDEDDGFIDAKLSPDGSTIVYISRAGDIVLYSLQDGSKRLLTTEYRYGYSPIWSPDGRSIAFSILGRPKSAIVIAPVEGGPARKILEAEREYYCSSFCPKGEKIALYSRYGGNYEITTVDVHTGELQQLTSPPYEKLYPAWSPDGATIAYVANDDSCSATSSTIWLLPAAGGQARALATFEGRVSRLFWSPDGTSLACYAGTYSQEGLFLLSLADGSATLLTEERVAISGWFPDGRTLLMLRTMETSTIRAVSVDDKQARLISDKKIDTASNPIWLSDTDVAFTRRKAASEYASSRYDAVWMISTTGGSSAQLPIDSTSNKLNLVISPDRTQILFDNGYDIYLQAVAGGPVTNLTAHTSEMLSEPSWSPDGKQIVCRHSSGLKVFALLSNKLVERKFFPGRYSEPAWSSNLAFGSPIAFVGNGGIYTVSLEDSEPKFVLSAYSPDWSPDGRWIASIRSGNIYISKVFGEVN
jgi:Tol biopolymer transport system component